jgi:hypothetical protein
LLDESVNQLAFLNVNVLVRSTLVIRQLRLNLVDRELLAVNLHLFEHTHGESLCNVDDGGRTFGTAATTLRLELHELSEEVLALGGTEINFGIGMHAESEGSLRRQFGIDVLEVLVVVLGYGALETGTALSIGEELSFVEKLIVEEFLEVACAQNTIPVIDNVTTVHDLTDQVLKIIPWHLSRATSAVHVVSHHDG